MKRLKTIIISIATFPRRHWKLSLLAVVLVVGGGFLFWRQQQAAQPVYSFIQPEVKDLHKTIQVSGVVDATEKANLRFAAGGRVVYLGAQEGDQVKKGQTIATIDRAELEKRLQQDLNAYIRERWDWETVQDGTDYPVEPLDTRRELDKLQTELNDTVLSVEIRDIAIRNTVLSAPFAGVLVGSPITVAGLHVLPTDSFEVINPKTLVFKAAVDEADISGVQLGQLSEISLDAFPDAPIRTSVNSIAYKSSQTSTGTVFVVELDLAQSELASQLRLGMNGDATITVDIRSQVLSVPLDATRQRDGKTYVEVKTGEHTVEEREITIGLETDDDVEVLSGLTVNDQVVIPDEAE